MKPNIFIPETIKVGYQERSDTYTGKLAYVIYTDEKGKLRKETSWNSWRKKDIEPDDYNNEPTSGFVLNKKAGGYSTGWNHRNTYVRVYDPRGFEFEISVANLLYILENTNSIKGKGLEGEFVYGWEGTELILMPVDAPDYKEIMEYTELLQANKTFKSADMIPGATYLTKSLEKLVYLGKFHEYGWSYSNQESTKKKGKSYFFYNEKSYGDGIETLRSLNKFIDVVSEECVENYAELMDKLEQNSYYSPIDPSKDEYHFYTLEEVEAIMKKSGWFSFYGEDRKEYHLNRHRKSVYGEEPIVYHYTVEDRYSGGWNYSNRQAKQFETLKEAVEYAKPMYKNEFLENGNLYREGKKRG